MTLAEFLAEWLELVVKPTKRHNTYTGYERAVRLHIVPALGSLAVDCVTMLDVQRFVAALAAGHLSPGTVRLVASVLCCGLRWAVRRGLIDRNPAEGIETPFYDQPGARPLNRAEADAFIAACAPERLGSLFAVALYTGMRRGELLGLGWQHVNLAAPSVAVERQWLANANPPRFGAPKTRAGRRVIPLPAKAAEQLAERRERQAVEFLRADPRSRVDSDLVWTRPSGHAVTYDEYVTTLRRIFRRAGLPPRGGHQLRHSACSLMVAEGVHPRIIMAIMGHGSASTTMAIYAHVGPDSLANWSAAMDRLFGGEQNRAGG